MTRQTSTFRQDLSRGQLGELEVSRLFGAEHFSVREASGEELRAKHGPFLPRHCNSGRLPRWDSHRMRHKRHEFVSVAEVRRRLEETE